MVLVRYYICCFSVLLTISGYGQIDKKTALNNAQREYEKGNYERSLDYLKPITDLQLTDDYLEIKRRWLLTENYIELSHPEEKIINNLDSILLIDPLFSKGKYNLEMSSRMENRLLTIDVYPNWVLSASVTRDLMIPVIIKEPNICADCIVSDEYSFSEMGSNFNINLAYFLKNRNGIEAGIGYATANYSRYIESMSGGDEYSVQYNERLQFIDFPVRYIITLNKWNIRVGANYKYLIQSNAKVYHTGVEIQQVYSLDDLQKIRNRNLAYLGFGIDRKIYPTKGKSLWYLSLSLNAQIGLNSFISSENRLSDIDFISDTYYTDDMIKMAMIGLGLRINYNANYKIH